MKVYIGPYIDWIGPYQIAKWFKKIGVSEDQCDKIGEWLNKTWVRNFCEWIDSKRKIKVKIKIHNYDVWSADYTLARIIYPTLKKLREIQHGAPHTDDVDVPEGLGLRSTEAPPKENDWDTDENWFKRWDWILNEIIWTFEQLTSENNGEDQFYDRSECTKDSEDIFDMSKSKVKIDQEGIKKHDERIDNGLRLFGKYYRGLWD